MTGVTPLRQALVRFDPNMADLLLQHGADINAVNAEGRSVLMYAAEGVKNPMRQKPVPRPDVIGYLLQHGADPARRDRAGKTARDAAQAPLENAPSASEDARGFQEVIAMLDTTRRR